MSRIHMGCLLLIDKVRAKDKTYIVGVVKNWSWGIYAPRIHWVCLLWINKARAKEQTDILVSVRWKTWNQKMSCFFCVHIFFLFHFCGALLLTLFVIWRVEFKWFSPPKNIFSCRGCFWPLFFQLKCLSPCLSATQILSFDMVSATSTAVSKEKGEGGTEEWEEHERSGCRI